MRAGVPTARLPRAGAPVQPLRDGPCDLRRASGTGRPLYAAAAVVI